MTLSNEVNVSALMAAGHDSMVIVAVPAADDPIYELAGPEAHCTMTYLGTLTEGHVLLTGTLVDAMAMVAEAMPAFTAKVNGTGHLGENEATVLLLESQELVDIHDLIVSLSVVKDLQKISDGTVYPAYIPHLTIDQDGKASADNYDGPEEVHFDRIAIWAGGNQFSFQLGGPQPEDMSTLSTNSDNIVDMDEEKPKAASLKLTAMHNIEEFTKLIDASITGLEQAFAKAEEKFAKVNEAITAAYGKFDPSLHPRGADGRFIEKWGIIKWLTKAGKWDYGQVTGIEKSKFGDGIDLTITPSDLSGTPSGEPAQVLKPSQVYRAPKAKAKVSINDPKAKKIGGQGGSNPGGLYSIPAKKSGLKEATEQDIPDQQFYVKKSKSNDHGANEALANQLYEAAGVPVPDTTYVPGEGNFYSKIVNGKPDMAQRLNSNDTEWMDKVRRNFAVDAWLGNRDVFGMSYDNILTDSEGTPWRIDNGGALLYRAMGAPKTDFGSKVTELDVFRTGKKSKVFGPNMSKDQELDGAQRVLAVSPDMIEDMVAQAGLPKSLAATLKARRAYIADYYGLPLPESIKPDTELEATTAPLVDPADIAKGKGKGRAWFPMTLAEAAFVLNHSDVIELPDGVPQRYGFDADVEIGPIGAQNQLLAWQKKFGPNAEVFVRKSITSAGGKRPDHLAEMAPYGMVKVRWNRGDYLEAPDGTKYSVMGANKATGGMLLQQIVPEGQSTPAPFLIDTQATKPMYASFVVHRWDPPVVKNDPIEVPSEPEMPAEPSGMSVPAAAAVKADLETPLPDGTGTQPGAAKTSAAPGAKSMILGDGTEAFTGDKVISKFGGEYVFVKPKGPYAVVTDPNSDDPTKLLTKKSNTLYQEGKEKADVPEAKAKPTTADGKIPVLGMTAKAKDGHEGEITMISPDGKFVFITDSTGKKKRKSVGTVTITSEPKPVDIEQTPESPDVADVPDVVDVPLPAAGDDVVAAAGKQIPDEGEYLPLSALALKVGDKVSSTGTSWYTVDALHSDGSIEFSIENYDTPIVLHPQDAAGTFLLKPALEPKIKGIPGDFVPEDGDLVAQISPKGQAGEGGLFYVSQNDGLDWFEIDSNGLVDTTVSYSWDELDPSGPGNGEQQIVYGNWTPPAPAGYVAKMDLSTPNGFLGLKPGDKISDPNGDAVVMGYPINGNSDAFVPVKLPDGQIVPFFMSAFPAGEIDVQTGNDFVAITDDELPTIKSIYANSFLPIPSSAVPATNSAIKYLALQQGIDPNMTGKLYYDENDDSFWSLPGATGTFAAKWDQSTSKWVDQPNAFPASYPPDIDNEPDLTPPDLPDTPAVNADPVAEIDTPTVADYKVKPNDHVISLTPTKGAPTETFWVEGENQMWYGVVNGAVSKTHPLASKDIENLTSVSGGNLMAKKEIWPVGQPSKPTTLDDGTVIEGLPGTYTPEPGTKLKKFTYGGNTDIYVQNEMGNWHSVKEAKNKQGYKISPTNYPTDWLENAYASTDTKAEDITVPGGVPAPAGPAKMSPDAGPAGVFGIPVEPKAMADLPEQIQKFLTENPGSGVVQTLTDSGVDHYYMVTPDGKVHYASPSGNFITQENATQATLLEKFQEKKSTHPSLVMKDITPAPDPAAPAPAEPVTFDGYTPEDGDQVMEIMSFDQSSGTYFVKKEGGVKWYPVQGGSLDMGIANSMTDEEVEWAIGEAGIGGKIVLGDFVGSSTTPAVVTEPVAPGPTPIKPGEMTANGKPIPAVDWPKLNGLGEISPGYTLWQGSNYGDGSPNTYYLSSNTGQIFKLGPSGGLSKTWMTPEYLSSGAHMVTFDVPAAGPASGTSNVSGFGATITGWHGIGAPSPSVMAKVETGQVVTTTADQPWAYVQFKDGTVFLTKVQPGKHLIEVGKVLPTEEVYYAKADGKLGDKIESKGLDLNSKVSGVYAVPQSISSIDVLTPDSTPDVTAPAAPAAPKPSTPTFPGEFLPDAAAVASWGGELTKDGHIPTIGMHVKRASMTGVIVGINKDKTKVTVQTTDGKKSLRQISLLTVDKAANYKAYAPAPVPVDIPAGAPFAADPPAEALKKTLQDGKWRPILTGTKGVRNGSIIVTSTTTPSGKKVNRVQLTLTKEQRELLVAKLSVGGAGVPKGDWVSSTKMSDDISAGDKLPMRKSTTPNPDGTDRWKVDGSVVPPTHEVVGVSNGANGVKVVTLQDINTGETIVSRFHPGKSVAVYTWDPNKPKKVDSNGKFIGDIAASQGWSATAANDYVISTIDGGTVNGKLNVEPGKPVSSSSAAIGWVNGTGGARKINSDGSIIEILGLNATGTDSANGVTVITLPGDLDEKALGTALADLGLDTTPMTKESSKHAARGMIKNLVSLNYSDPDSFSGWSDEKLFTEAGKAFGISDLGWHDVLVGSTEDGKVSYFWSKRVQDQIMAKSQFSVVVRGGTNASPQAIASQFTFGHANGILKRTAGMQGGHGISASSDAKNNAAHGSYSSALGPSVHGLPSTNPLFSKGTGFMVYTHPLAITGRIQDWRTGPEHGDAYGAGPNYGKSATAGGNSLTGMMTQSKSQDFWLGSGFGADTIGYLAVNTEKDRTAALAEMHKQGIFMINGRSVEEILITKAQANKINPKDIPLPAPPANLTPIDQLPENYPAAAVASSEGAAA